FSVVYFGDRRRVGFELFEELKALGALFDHHDADARKFRGLRAESGPETEGHQERKAKDPEHDRRLSIELAQTSEHELNEGIQFFLTHESSSPSSFPVSAKNTSSSVAIFVVSPRGSIFSPARPEMTVERASRERSVVRR